MIQSDLHYYVLQYEIRITGALNCKMHFQLLHIMLGNVMCQINNNKCSGVKSTLFSCEV